jgi:hypothetical protein
MLKRVWCYTPLPNSASACEVLLIVIVAAYVAILPRWRPDCL